MLERRVDRRALFTDVLPDATLKALGLGTIAALLASRKAFASPLEQEPEKWVLHWDNTWKRVNPEGGIKFIIIPGLGSNSQDTESFRSIKEKSIYAAGFDEHDVLDISYNVNTNNERLGEQYDRENSTQNPAISEGNMHMLMLWYKQHFPKDKFVIIGHSQGGYLAYELARRHPDEVAAIITLDGALKGADIIPGSLDEKLAAQIGGKAGEFFFKRGQTHDAFWEVEREVRNLVEREMYFFPFSSGDDIIVNPQHGYVDTANRKIGGRTIETLFNMGYWVNSPVPKYFNAYLEEDQTINNNLDNKTSDESAQLTVRRNLVGSWDGHSAVLSHPKVLEQIKYIISIIASENKYSTSRTTGYSNNQRENSGPNTNPLTELLNWLFFGFGR